MKGRYGLCRLAIQVATAILIIVGGMQSLSVTLPIIMGVTFFGGAFFCGWMCPFGTMQDLVSKLTWRVNKMQMPLKLQRVLAVSRYVILAATTLLTTDFVFTLLQQDARENFLSITTGRVLSGSIYATLALYLILAVFFERPFCTYMCPEGAKNGLISGLRPFRVVRDENLCINCGKCNKACPMHIDVEGHANVKSLQCINCFNCIAECPKKGALRYGMIRLSMKGMVAYVIAVFLVVTLGMGALAYDFMNGKTDDTVAQQDSTQAMTEIVQPEEVAASNIEEITLEPEQTNPTQQTKSVKSAQTTQSTQTAQSTQTTQPAQTTQTAQPQTQATGSGYKDGVYTGQADGFRGPMTVSVTVKGGEITNVEVVDSNDDWKWLKRAMNYVPDWIIQKQSSDVDVVSGATYSSLGIINATENALKKAK